ncbi:MAG: hypothetical protein KIS78_32880 [Labilithrix sp.]|nr:hypothetical protein [Labilithrix sp.]
MIGVPLAPRAIGDVAARHGGTLRNGVKGTVRRLVPIRRAGAGDLTVLLNARYVEDAHLAVARGAMLLVDEALAAREDVASLPGWFHAHAAWAMAELLDSGDAAPDAPVVGSDCRIGPGVHLLPRVRIGERVTIAPGAVIGAAGFGFVTAPDGQTREIPQLGGVVIEDDVHIGALCTIAAGTIGPTIIRRGAKLDAQVHVGHNCEIGEGAIIAAQSGLAGFGGDRRRGVLVGDRSASRRSPRPSGTASAIAAKSGVIGDVAAGFDGRRLPRGRAPPVAPRARRALSPRRGNARTLRPSPAAAPKIPPFDSRRPWHDVAAPGARRGAPAPELIRRAPCADPARRGLSRRRVVRARSLLAGVDRGGAREPGRRAPNRIDPAPGTSRDRGAAWRPRFTRARSSIAARSSPPTSRSARSAASPPAPGSAPGRASSATSSWPGTRRSARSTCSTRSRSSAVTPRSARARGAPGRAAGSRSAITTCSVRA